MRITASQPVACVLLPPVLARMRQALPEVQVELVASNQVTNLLRREADIALRMVRPDQASLVAKRIGAVTLGAYAHRDYLRRKGTPRQPPDLLQHELVGNDRHEDIQQGFAAMGYPVERGHFAFRTDDLMGLLGGCAGGAGHRLCGQLHGPHRPKRGGRAAHAAPARSAHLAHGAPRDPHQPQDSGGV